MNAKAMARFTLAFTILVLAAWAGAVAAVTVLRNHGASVPSGILASPLLLLVLLGLGAGGLLLLTSKTK